MLRSEKGILTTHTGSLPRPHALLQLYGRRSCGEPVDEAAIDAGGRDAMRAAVQGQIDCGIDVGNNGEQQREGFFLYAQRRMTGFGGTWRRWPRQDVERYPEYKRMAEARDVGREGVTSLAPPCVIGDVRYRDPALAEAEPIEFRQT